MCQPCHKECLTCDGAASNNCLSCPPDGNTYLDAKMCKLCSYKCTKCSAFTVCKECAVSTPDPRNGSPNCDCDVNYFYDLSEEVNCQPCHKTCLKCNGS